MNILITGGAGFIGSQVALRLVDDGHTVTVLDNLSLQIHGQDPYSQSPLLKSILGRVDFIEGSVCNEADWSRAMAGQNAIVHLAAETGTGQSMYEIKRYTDVNVGGTAIMLDLLANRPHKVERVVVASSRAIYGEGKYRNAAGHLVYPASRNVADLEAGRFDPIDPESGTPLICLPTDEESKIHPSSVYGITKHNQEQMVMTVCPSLGIQPVALRFQNVYGPGQSLKNPYTGILSIFSTRILNANPIQIFEDGQESRDFVYIDDVVTSLVAALFHPLAAGEIFGIGSGQATPVISVARALVSSLRREVPVHVTGAFRVGDIRHNYADLRKAASLLGFDPKVTLEAGIRKFADWVMGQEVNVDTYEASMKEMQNKGLFRGTLKS